MPAHAPLDPAQLLNWPIEALSQRYTVRDIMFYALSLGIGQAPLDPAQLAYVYEEGLAVLPAFATVLADPGPWLGDPSLGLDWTGMLHGAQRIELHRPLSTSAHVRSESRVTAVEDLGRERGARVVTRRKLFDADDGAHIATLDMTSILRTHGGFGSAPRARESAPHEPLKAARRHAFDYAVPPQTALLFRLNGDMNGLHADPAIARAAGFAQPILHGMASFGIAGYMLLRALERAPGELREMEARFSAPVFPGDTLRIEASSRTSTEGEQLSFDVFAIERNVKVMTRGAARFGPA
ncbi:MaoC/PaaZ C-terminal domain-containing protein [Caballeronia sp. LZ035]|uniref:MaoC/PaaZ C-terminal domain-containing protein n=1 Tax=Caballeronia sp. LZ035 TaxID=3038568 RepID=UPI00286510E1|nr:MaoC/PaaZ C-terminal domain-containing protein [Caballeronia sp. LZ035]MDR5759351.1 MaoC/PaaZ C-terminal domain-containing protein [Caballeronia sp. LZ035]